MVSYLSKLWYASFLEFEYEIWWYSNWTWSFQSLVEVGEVKLSNLDDYMVDWVAWKPYENGWDCLQCKCGPWGLCK